LLCCLLFVGADNGVLRLIDQLDSQSLAERNAAEAELVRLGEVIEPQLPLASDDSLSPEQARRLRRIREQYDEAAVRQVRDAIRFSVAAHEVRSQRHILTVRTEWPESDTNTKTRLIRLKFPMRALQIQEDGWSVETPDAVLEAPIAGIQENVSIRFVLISDTNQEALPPLSARCDVLFATRYQGFRFNDLTVRNKSLKQGDATVTLERADWTASNHTLRVRLRVRFDDPADALQSWRTWIYENRAYLAGTPDNDLAPKRTRTVSRTEEDVVLEYMFDLSAGKWDVDQVTFVYETPTILREEKIDFLLQLNFCKMD